MTRDQSFHAKHTFIGFADNTSLGRVLIKDIALKPFVFCHLLCLHEVLKSMKLNNEAREFKMRMLEKEILNLVGERREKAMTAYRRLLSSASEELIYLMRS